MKKLTFHVYDKEVNQLRKSDPVINTLIEQVGTIELNLEKDYYRSLVRQIIGQQLSLKAAATIGSRVTAVWKDFHPENLKEIEDDELRSAGLSKAKITYIRHLTENVLNGQLDFQKLEQLEDGEVIKELTKVKGIGQWTAEMFLIFSLGRLNILSFKDISIQNTIRWLYQIPQDEKLNLEKYFEKWSPYNSIASLYLWAGLDRGLLTKNGITYLENE